MQPPVIPWTPSCLAGVAGVEKRGATSMDSHVRGSDGQVQKTLNSCFRADDEPIRQQRIDLCANRSLEPFFCSRRAKKRGSTRTRGPSPASRACSNPLACGIGPALAQVGTSAHAGGDLLVRSSPPASAGRRTRIATGADVHAWARPRASGRLDTHTCPGPVVRACGWLAGSMHRAYRLPSPRHPRLSFDHRPMTAGFFWIPSDKE
jgi:hypothetical protein